MCGVPRHYHCDLGLFGIGVGERYIARLNIGSFPCNEVLRSDILCSLSST